MNVSQEQELPRMGRALRIALTVGGGGLLCALILLPQLRAILRGRPVAATGSLVVGTQEASELLEGEPEDLVVEEVFGEALLLAPSDKTLQPTYASESRFREKIRWVQTLSVLPVEDHRLASAHELARRNACEPIPAGEPVLLHSFRPYLTRRDTREYGENVPALSTRQPIFSVGMGMLPSDQRALPTLSARRILTYLRGNYITLQVRVQKEPISGELFLHHRSLAGVAQYRASKLTQQPTEGLGKTLQNYRSLGLFLPEGEEPTPQNLRTLVLLHKSERASDAGVHRSSTKYEYVFIRARTKGSGREQSLELHTFATSDRRQKLHYLKLGSEPSRSDFCSFKTMVYFTDYSHAGLYPVESASRGTVFNDRAEYAMEELEAYAVQHAWTGGVLQNVTPLLDAIIDGEIVE